MLIWHSYPRLHSKSNLCCEIKASNKECNRKIKWKSSVEYKTISQVEWITKNVIALGFSNGLIEISEIDEHESGKNRVIKQFNHKVSIYSCAKFNQTIDYVLFPKDGITSLIWNGRTQYLASCSYDKRIKVSFGPSVYFKISNIN